jgi:hypothetical protein
LAVVVAAEEAVVELEVVDEEGDVGVELDVVVVDLVVGQQVVDDTARKAMSVPTRMGA